MTAGAAGIGRAIAGAFPAGGHRVHVCDIVAEARADFSAASPAAGTTRAGIAEVDDVERVFENLHLRLYGLDVLFNNARIAGSTRPVETVSPADWRRCVAVNLDSAFLCARRAAPLLEPQRAGVIVNIASTAGLHGYPDRTPCAAAEWSHRPRRDASPTGRSRSTLTRSRW
ncbi:MAG: SDR family NAD(P)-dependent oxidoreductase [Gammaproteobacteria bacterium]|nr:SDR family NAD(P)-dependent oxidoreductase [Gammaproteobacteria bacterium]